MTTQQFNSRDLVGKHMSRATVATEIRSAFNKDTREVAIAFASEAPVDRYYGIEILSCDPANVDLSRLNNGAPLLKNHNACDQIGGVVSATVDADKVCRSVCKLSRNECGIEAENDIVDGILRHASVGYVYTREISNTMDNDGIRTVVWAWQPLEITLTAIPADDTVGVGRSLDTETQTKAGIPAQQEKRNMSAENKTEVAPVDAGAIRNEAREIVALGRMHKAETLADTALEKGWALDVFRKALIEELGKRNQPSTQAQGQETIGMSSKEIKRYSLMNVVRHLAGERVDIGFEREMSQAVAKVYGRSARGIFMPYDLAVEQRDLQIAGAGTGSNFVATNVMAGNFITALRAKLALQALGVPSLTGLVGDIAIPAGAAVTGYWVAETSAPTESTPVLSQVTATPRQAGATVDISRKLMIQSSVDVENYVRNEIAVALASTIDAAAFNGAGTAEPTGLLTGPISTDVSVTAGTPTFAEIANMLATVEGKNVNLDTVKWAMPSACFWKLATTATSTNGPVFIADYNTGKVIGKPCVVSSNVTAKYAIAGDWNQMVLCLWGTGLDIVVDPFTGSKTGTVSITGFADADIAIRQAAAFAHADILS